MFHCDVMSVLVLVCNSYMQPPSLGFTVTKEQLVAGLNDVLTGSPLLAPYCLPLLMEKLASSSVDAKIESLKTLVRSCGPCCLVHVMSCGPCIPFCSFFCSFSALWTRGPCYFFGPFCIAWSMSAISK